MPVDFSIGIRFLCSGTRMRPVLIAQNCQAESAGTIIDFLSARQIPFREVHTYRGEPLPNPDELSAVICLGCPISVTEYHQHDYLRDLYRFVANVVRADLPYLGICYGGQLLAGVLGARVERNPVREIGVYTVRLTDAGKADPLFASLGSSFPVVQWHGDTFALPFGCPRLVEGTDCVNQAFKHKRQVALQFHLEATESLVQTWCDVYPSELAEMEKSVADLLIDFRRIADTLKQMNFAFLESFFLNMKTDQPTNHMPHGRLSRSH
ncbi:GMP synthase [candidate division GN15 bacterium]|uniref:GMP synthase n=1 Tax=candidate division GN15 bacterium TaxID=2072418 RepID=A0A855X2X6_9BACT|nr:MAG: GMP synthase [candidate division GN15 bacterium]